MHNLFVYIYMILWILILACAQNPFSSENQIPGYLPINRDGLSMFYWLFKARDQTIANPPLIIWLEGGPGCAGVSNALVDNGPFDLQLNGTLLKNPYAWNNFADVIFIDQPMCVGFSFCQSVNQVPLYEKGIAADIYQFLKNFMNTYPNYKGRPFYVTGVSYGGHYVPALARYLLDQNDPNINVQGIEIGNGLIDGNIQDNKNVDFIMKYRKLTLIQQLSAKFAYTLMSVFSNIGWKILASKMWLMGELIISRVNGEFCFYDITKPANCLFPLIGAVLKYVNTKTVYDALGITSTQPYKDCNDEIFYYLSKDEMTPVTDDLIEVLNRGVKVFIVEGLKDFMCNNDGMLELITTLNWKYATQFNNLEWQDYYVMGRYTGKIKTYGPLTYITDELAGHMVVEDDKQASFDIIERLTN
jgi:carboxypeptidase C (cathepsin A)